MGAVRIATGPEVVKAANKNLRILEARDLWPYAWEFAPPGSTGRNPSGSVVIPAVGASSVIMQYTVPTGQWFEMTHVMFCAVTTGMMPIGNPGDFTFTINRNTPPTGVAPQGSPLADFQAVSFPMGNPIFGGMVKLSRSRTFAPLDIIRVYGNNVSGPATAPNYFVAMIAGWERKA